MNKLVKTTLVAALVVASSVAIASTPYLTTVGQYRKFCVDVDWRVNWPVCRETLTRASTQYLEEMKKLETWECWQSARQGSALPALLRAPLNVFIQQTVPPNTCDGRSIAVFINNFMKQEYPVPEYCYY